MGHAAIAQCLVGGSIDAELDLELEFRGKSRRDDVADVEMVLAEHAVDPSTRRKPFYRSANFNVLLVTMVRRRRSLGKRAIT